MRRLAATLIIAFLPCGLAMAQEEPVVRVDVSPSEITVGESAVLNLTVLVPTWFPRPPVYPSLELPNAITRLPPDSSYPTSERIGRETWSGIVRNYRVYPMLGARYRLEGLSIKVAYANPGAAPIVRDVAIPPIEFRGVVPAGAEDIEPYLAGRSLELSLETESDAANLAVGDAVVIRYTATLDGLPAMFLPPLAPSLQLEGVSVYASEPVVTDGEPARREETLTLVFEAGGDFEVPGIELEYWSTVSASVAVASAPSLNVSVEGPPVTGPTDVSATPGFRWGIVALVGLGVALVVALWLAGPRVSRLRQEAIQRRLSSERYAFGLLEDALRRGEAGESYAALLNWLSRLGEGLDARTFAARFGDRRLREAIDALIAANYAEASTGVDSKSLRAGLAAARRQWREAGETPSRDSLPALNP